MRHAEDPFVVVLVLSIQLTVDGVARSAASDALRTPSLGNKPGDDPVEFQAFVEALLGQFDKVGHRLGGVFLEKLHGHGALVGVNFRVHGTKMHHSSNMGKPLTMTIFQVKQMEMNRLRWCLTCLLIGAGIAVQGQLLPESSSYNDSVVWEAVFTDGPSGKVNRGIVDSDGHCVAASMPLNSARVVKANGATGALMWSTVISNRVAFGLCEVEGDGHPDYIISGGAGNSQERWLTRLDGSDGSIMWDQVYTYAGGGGQYDGLRNVTVGADGFVYASGFVQADESDTIFVVYAGSAVMMKVDPSSGEVIWSSVNSASEYCIASVQASDGMWYSGGVMYEEGLSLTKRNGDGAIVWTEVLPLTQDVIPYDLAIGQEDNIYFGGHSPRPGAGFPYDYTCIALNTGAAVQWMQNYANPRGYSLSHIRNELYGLEVGTDGIYLFGGSGDESNYSATNPPFPSSNVWVGWVLGIGFDGAIARSDVFSHQGVNSATEYGALIDGGYVIFNDTDAGGDAEVGIIKVLNGSNASTNCPEDFDNDLVIGVADVLAVLGDFGCSQSCQFDANGDGFVNVADVLQVIALFGNSCD